MTQECVLEGGKNGGGGKLKNEKLVNTEEMYTHAVCVSEHCEDCRKGQEVWRTNYPSEFSWFTFGKIRQCFQNF